MAADKKTHSEVVHCVELEVQVGTDQVARLPETFYMERDRPSCRWRDQKWSKNSDCSMFSNIFHFAVCLVRTSSAVVIDRELDSNSCKHNVTS